MAWNGGDLSFHFVAMPTNCNNRESFGASASPSCRFSSALMVSSRLNCSSARSADAVDAAVAD